MIRLIDYRRMAFIVWAVIATLLATLSACTPVIPRPDQITAPALGTLMAGGHEEAVTPVLPPDQSGVLLANQTGERIQVVVNNTIVEIPRAYDFLFSLPPGKYEFYIFEPDSAPYAHSETLEGSKLRYLYISHLGQPGG